ELIPNGYEGNTRLVYSLYPELAEKIGVRLSPDGSASCYDLEETNRRLEIHQFHFKLWRAKGVASIIDTLKHLAEDVPEFPCPMEGGQHFHDYVGGPHFLAYCTFTQETANNIRDTARLFLKLLEHKALSVARDSILQQARIFVEIDLDDFSTNVR